MGLICRELCPAEFPPTFRRWALSKWPRACRAFFSAALCILEMGYDQSFRRCFKPTLLGPLPKVGQLACAVQLGGHDEGRGSCKHSVCFQTVSRLLCMLARSAAGSFWACS